MMINKTILAAALVAVALTSCETKENSHRETQPFEMLNYVTNGTDETYSIGISAITIEYIGTSASGLSIRDVVMNGGEKKNFEVTGLTNKNVTNGMGFIESASSAAPGMTDLSINLLGGTSFISTWNLFYNFTAGTEKVCGMPKVSFYFSKTNVTDPVGAPVLTTEDGSKNRYQITVNDKDINTASRTLNIYVIGASFMQGMPAMNMVFKDVPFEIENGVLKFAINRLVPSVLAGENGTTEVPNDKFPITDLEGVGRIGDEVTLKYSCTPTLNEGNSTTYNVESTLKFRLQKQSGSTQQ